ncbi:MAG: hypothetical protein P1Q69_16335 [Candidatus Thorarchaeota archaeon]|nr:hypothetical protein [Candidatus Thorarchaeota archaeon]
MSTDLERALSKLRFDDQVLGYSLMTKMGRPFVSFAFPDELVPRVKDSIGLYKSDLRLMTIDTEKGLVVLSPVDDNWILTVLYVPELQLGLAIAKTKNVLRLLEGIELPPPPEEFEDSAETNLKVLESIAIKAASTAAEEASAPAPAPIAGSAAPTQAAPAVAKTAADFAITPSTVPKRGPTYANSLSLESPLYNEMKTTYRNFGFDVLMLLDGSMDVAGIADTMFQPTERVIELLGWAATRGIVEVPVAEETSSEESTPGKMGHFVKCPKFEGDDSKISASDMEILKLCNGSRTTEEIAKTAGIAYSGVIQVLARHRKSIKMIGKTI